VILLEAVLQPANTPDLGKLIDLEMVVMTGGRERTEEEPRALFDRAGFKMTRVIPTKSPLSVIEAR
jgi:O-methyltransferase domain